MMIIKILWTGCPKCKLLEQITRDVVTNKWIQADIIKITEMEEILQYDIMSTPALVVNEEVVISGRIPDEKELEEILINR